ncbi:MAG: DUF998 domain-containing protein [Candidatus Njordarchaeia archaeon]
MAEIKLKYKMILGLLFPIAAYASIFLAMLNAPWFSWKANALSDLGVAPGSDIIFNYGLIISGLIYVIYIILNLREEESYLVIAGYFILILSGIALMLVGIYPENIKIPHLMAAWGYFLSFPIGAIVTSIGEIKEKEDKLVLVLAIISFVAFITVLIIPWKTLGVTGLAIPEIIAATSNMIWHTYYLMRKTIQNIMP